MKNPEQKLNNSVKCFQKSYHQHFKYNKINIFKFLNNVQVTVSKFKYAEVDKT